MSKLMRAIGMMSGTSLDGIDVAMIETDGGENVVRGPSQTIPYTDEQRNELRHALALSGSLVEREARPGPLGDIERRLTGWHVAALAAFRREHGLDDVDVIGLHGQTVLHDPARELTVQLGLGEVLAREAGAPVVYDLRAADVAAGGQGAPLVPIYHRALTARLPQRPLAVVNIGGVANVTWIGHDGGLIAFDTGPGNALLDDWMMRETGAPFDDGGALASTGRVDEERLRDLLLHPFYAAAAPKSLDRNAFDVSSLNGLTAADGAATLTALTAAGIGRSRSHMPDEPELWIIAGGGRRNRTLMRRVAEMVGAAVVPSEAVGLDGDSIEAEAWAYLAVRSLRGLPITFPTTTGVARPTPGGRLAQPSA